MDNVFDELDELNTAFVMRDDKIQRINFSPLLDDLYISKEHILKTAPILDFMASLQGRNKSSGKNGISRLQSFLNAYIQENALRRLNEDTLQFINNDHDFLLRGGHGEDDAEFYFKPQNGLTYKLEAKMYWDEASFRKNLPTTNFHNADYVCLFFIKDSNYHWAFAKKEDNYEKIYRLLELAKTDPHILDIHLQSSLTTISFDIDNNLTDSEVPEEVLYRFYNN